MQDTVIVVAQTRKDTYGNLWVMPKGSSEEVKIGSKRAHLFELFQQDKAVTLRWETYKDRPYVADAKLVEGELSNPQPTDNLLPADQKTIDEVMKRTITPPAPQEIGLWWKELGLRIGDGSLEKDYPNSVIAIKGQYYKKMSEITQVVFKSEP